MPNPKTVLRVALAAVAVPGVVAGVAAPAASAAELPQVQAPLESSAAGINDSSILNGHGSSLSLPEGNQMDGHAIDMSAPLR